MIERPDGTIAEMTAMNLGESENDELVPFAAEYSEKQIKILCSACGQKLDVTELDPFQRIACPVCGAALTVPMRFDRYMLEKPIHEYDNTYKVYLGLDMVLERPVSVKVLKTALAEQPGKSSAFLREAVVTASINHFAIIPIYNCGVFRGIPYIVMQYLAGGSLESYLRKNPGVPRETAVRWVRDITSGLDYAAKAGLFHRDLRPANLLLTEDEHVKICDFVIQFVPKISLETSRDIFGRYHYASPERVRNAPETSASDIFSLGVLFYYLLSGRMPYSGKTPEDILNRRVSHYPPFVRNVKEPIPKELSSLVMRMLDPHPERRPLYPEIELTLSDWLKVTARKKRKALPHTEHRNDLLTPIRCIYVAVLTFLFSLCGLLWLCLRGFFPQT